MKAKNDNLIREFLQKEDGRSYDVRPDGTIWTLRDAISGHKRDTWRQITCTKSKQDPYIHISYKHRKLQAHRIVYQKYCGNLDASRVINHKDHNPSNNHPNNLELVTVSINNLHAGIRRSPNRCRRKLTMEQANEIRQLHQEHGWTYTRLMHHFNIKSKGHVSDIINEKIYATDSTTIEEKINRITRTINNLQQQKTYLVAQLKQARNS